MAVIVRTTLIDEQGKEQTTIQYRCIRPPTQEDIRQAKKLDLFLNKRMEEIQDKLKEKRLLETRLGNLSRWHALGTELAIFIDDSSIVPVEDRVQDRYIWEAIGQHSPDDLHPGKKASNSKNVGTDRDHFRLCYLVATFQNDLKKAKKQGTWRDWVELLESKSILQDERILNWLRIKLRNCPDLKLRPIARMLRHRLKDMYTQVLSDRELNDYLDDGWNNLLFEYDIPNTEAC